MTANIVGGFLVEKEKSNAVQNKQQSNFGTLQE
jgi:hypothetical protein